MKVMGSLIINADSQVTVGHRRGKQMEKSPVGASDDDADAPGVS